MKLVEANPEEARVQLRKLRKYAANSGALEKLMIIDNAISQLNRMEQREAELVKRIEELEAQYYGYRGTFAEHAADES